MRINPEEELKASVFARIEAKIRGLPDMLRNDILESLTTEDKTMKSDPTLTLQKSTMDPVGGVFFPR
jgi:hypothetical protein